MSSYAVRTRSGALLIVRAAPIIRVGTFIPLIIAL